MADHDQSLYNIRYNQVTQGMEGFGGGTPQWTPLPLVADGTMPAGSNTQIQYNNNGAFGADANLTWDGSLATIGGNLTLAGGGDVVLNIGTGGSSITQAGSSDSNLHILAGGGGFVVLDQTNLMLTLGGAITMTGGGGGLGNITLDAGNVITTSGTIQGSAVGATTFVFFPALTTPPSSPIPGAVYFDTTIPSGTATGSLQVYDGTSWHTVTTV